jgi:hypothetical protein
MMVAIRDVCLASGDGKLRQMGVYYLAPSTYSELFGIADMASTSYVPK